MKRMASKHSQSDTLVAELADIRNRLDDIERRIGATPLPQVHRVLRWFDRVSDELVGSAPILGVKLVDLQRMFGVEPDNPMYDCYPVTPTQASQIQACVDAPILLDKYDYFVEADAVARPA